MICVKPNGIVIDNRNCTRNRCYLTNRQNFYKRISSKRISTEDMLETRTGTNINDARNLINIPV